jgi:hypothetical protein
MVNATPQPSYPREGDKIPVVQEAGWVSGLGKTGRENCTPALSSPQRVDIEAVDYFV